MSISSIGSGSGNMVWAMQSMQRPDPVRMAGDLFSKLDTSGKGYIEKSDLQSALDKIPASESGSGSSVDSLFSKMDADSSGKVTKDEFTNALGKVAKQLDNQFQQMRMAGGMGAGGGMPPPPPRAVEGSEDDVGFTKDELQSQLSALGDSTSRQSNMLSSLLDSFEEVDANSDGKASLKETFSFSEKQRASGVSAGGRSEAAISSSSEAGNREDSKIAIQIMQLMRTYGIGDQGSAGTHKSLLSVTA